MPVACVEFRIGGIIRAFSRRIEEIREAPESREIERSTRLLRRRELTLGERGEFSNAFEQGPETVEMSVSQLERTLFTMLWMAFVLTAICGAVFILTDDRAFAYSGGIIFGFCLAAVIARRMLAFGHIQGAVALVCLAILGALFLMVFVMPHIYQTIVVTSLLTASLALPYAGDGILRWLMVGSWIGAIAVGTVGPWILSRTNPENTGFDVLFGTLTVAAAAGLSLLILWQFRSRLLLSLVQARSAEEQMSHAATHDALTGLPNRSLLANDLEGAMDGIRENPSDSFAVLFLDLDRFKHVNDSLGHTLGDELLKMVAERITGCLGSKDTISRMGGDEFVVVLRGANQEDSERVATRIQNALKMPFRLYGHELYAAATIGIVVNTGEYARPDDLIRDADTAMYQAKHAGKGRHAVFDTDMRREAVSLLRLENELRAAVEHGRFVVHYQPIVWLASGGVVGFEALTRWDHPERGLLAPGEFMKMAEETGIIHDIDRLTLRAACRQTAIWREEFPAPFPPSVNVNISPSGLSRPGLIDEIERVLAETGLPGYALVLELTEGAVMQDSDNGLRILRELRNLGVRIHVDDFGTGYSSLELLHRLPVDALKIDRSFVSGMGENGSLENAEIVRTVLTMAHALGMDVVAEGVETSEHLELLRRMGCDYVQGYRFSRPVRRDKARAILAAEPVW